MSPTARPGRQLACSATPEGLLDTTFRLDAWGSSDSSGCTLDCTLRVGRHVDRLLAVNPSEGLAGRRFACHVEETLEVLTAVASGFLCPQLFLATTSLKNHGDQPPEKTSDLGRRINMTAADPRSR